jgi:predicted NBD/HSP70 family sugar kinase
VTGQPVLEVGGTHVLASRVDAATWRVEPGSAHRLPLDSGGTAEAILTTLAACARRLGLASPETLAVAIPGPFDYRAGIGRFRGVGKFDALAGVDVGRALRGRLAPPPARVTFVNDAEAFGLGEWLAGAARGYQRAVAITLGTGIGSAFVAAGRVVTRGPAVPPGGHVYRLTPGGRPLEETVSRRAIVASYRRHAPAAGPGLDVREIAALARGGDAAAARVFTEAFCHLGAALRPWLARFGAQVLVAGGGLTTSWPLIEPPLRRGLGPVSSDLVIVKSADPAAATAAGAAWRTRADASAPAAADPGAAPGPLASAGTGE